MLKGYKYDELSKDAKEHAKRMAIQNIEDILKSLTFDEYGEIICS